MKKQQVFYIHGGEAFRDYDKFLSRLRSKDMWDLPGTESSSKWTSTLAEDLGDRFEVFMPAMPNKQNAKYEEWKIWFERHFEYLRDDVILIGFSLGAMFLSKYFIKNKTPFAVKALFIMASPVEVGDFDDEDCGDFVFSLSDVGSISTKVNNIFILHSKDDFVVPYNHALKYKAALPEADFVTFEDKNHFLIAEFPELLKLIHGQVS